MNTLAPLKHFDEQRRDFAPYGFTCELWEAIQMRRPDRHEEIEINFLDTGTLTYMLGGRTITVQPRTLTVFWAAVPHQIIAHSDVTFYHVMTIPFGTFLEWGIEELRTQLVMGAAIAESDLQQAESDVLNFRRWTEDLEKGGDALNDIVLLEVHARLKRLAFSIHPCSDTSIDPASRPPNLKKAERMANYIARNYAERIQVKDIAQHAGIHPDYASTLFKQTYGTTLNAFLTKHRVADAQRRLITSDDQILHVAFAAGFDSLSRFNRVFKELTGSTPREFRKQYFLHRTKPAAR